MKKNLWTIIQREFMERVGKKSFIITTLLMPLLMLLLSAMPALILNFSTPTKKTVAVNDKSLKVFPALIKNNSEDLTFLLTDTPLDSVIHNEDYYGVLAIPADIVERPNGATLYLHEGGSTTTEQLISGLIEEAVRDQRMKKYDIPNLEEILADTDVDVSLQTVRVQESGEEEATSTALSFGIGFLLTFILYMFLLMYGQMVMTSIIEEKNNRVLELVVSSVRPTDLMMGKILGIGLVAVVQVVIWCVLMCAISAFVVPFIMPSAAELGANASEMSVLTSYLTVGYIVKLFAYILVFLIGGFLFYASIFAAIGSAVDNIQDASQLTWFAMLPIIVGLMIGLAAGNDPNSPLAFWGSMIPFTSPMVMLMRVPFGIPGWQVGVSIVVLYLSFLLMVWFAAKVYRVGIFMYGKKPNVKDLIRWAKYK